MKNKQAIIGALAVIFASIMWGFDGIVLTPRLFNLDVIFVVFMLHIIPFVIMNLFLYKEYRHMKHFSYADIFYLFLIAMFGGILGTISIVKALFLVNFEHLTVVVLLQKLQPVFSIILAGIILRETIRKRFVLWAAIAIMASYFLVFGLNIPKIDSTHETAEAAFFALLAAFTFGSSTVFSKKILNKYAFSTGTFYRYAFTSVILLLVVIISGRLSQFEMISTSNWIYFLIIAFTTGSGAIFLYYFGLIRIPAVLATMCELFFPLSAIVFDYIFNGKILNPVQWIAAALMIFAIIQLNRNKR